MASDIVSQSVDCEKPMQARRVSVVMQLQRQKDEVTERLADIDKAIALFNGNPLLAQAFDTVAQLGIRY